MWVHLVHIVDVETLLHRSSTVTYDFCKMTCSSEDNLPIETIYSHSPMSPLRAVNTRSSEGGHDLESDVELEGNFET
jgi:hypothetical protein